jgi:hypothetical protein
MCLHQGTGIRRAQIEMRGGITCVKIVKEIRHLNAGRLNMNNENTILYYKCMQQPRDLMKERLKYTRKQF